MPDQPAIDMEVYKQAHETRRQWENHIWQYSVLVTALIVLVAGRIPLVREIRVAAAPTVLRQGPGESDTAVKTAAPNRIDLVGKVGLTLLALFSMSIFLNVFRARTLMKRLEGSIMKMHRETKIPHPVIPAELNECLSRHERVSSTGVAVFCHAVAVAFFTLLAIYYWIER